MLIRFNKKSKPVEISTDEFDELVRKGKLTPKSLVKNKFIAKGKWVSIDNMERFHRKSPIEYPLGPYLIQSRKIKNRRKKQKDNFSILLANYASGKLIEQYLEGKRLSRSDLPLEIITRRERQVLKLIGEGHKNKEIADYLCISVKTVEKHRANLMKKLDLHSASALTAFAMEKGLITK